jgi:hypothetical protein
MYGDAAALLDATMWPTPATAGFHAMQVLPATGPQNEVLRFLGSMHDPRVFRPIGKELGTAVDALKALDAADRVGIGYGGNQAVLAAAVALQELAAALEAEAEDTELELPAISDYLADPPRLRDDLRHAIARFVRTRVAADVEQLRTFSVILFRDTDADGAIARSLVEERRRWRAALTPRDPSAADLHLVVIPPPTATAGVTALARDLGCAGKLPCVVFLGDKPDQALEDPSRLVRWSVRRLEAPPPPIPEQLEKIYGAVYDARMGAPGSLFAAAGERFVLAVRDHVDVVAVLQLLAGAVGGSALVGALTTVLGLFKKGGI